ncbi:MAG TPA: hypothetical protein VGN12_04245 [Pirellulales bacterium]|jgi:hypothetical protein
MAIAFTCPNCLADLKLKDQYAGECVNCPRCKVLMVVPDIADEEEEDEPRPPDEESYQPSEDEWLAHLAQHGKEEPAPEAKKESAPAVDVGKDPAEKIRFFCKSCGTKMSAAPGHAGRRVTCPQCHAKQRIPGGPDLFGDTSQATADHTATRPITRPDGVKVGSSESLFDALDDVTLHAGRPLSPYSQAAHEEWERRSALREPHWLKSWSTVWVAAGTAGGLMLAWVLMAAPSFFRDHIQPYFDKHVAPAIGMKEEKPTQQFKEVSEQAIAACDALVKDLRRITDVHAAKATMPQYITDLTQMFTLQNSVETLRGRMGNAQSADEFQKLQARMRDSQDWLDVEMKRCSKISGVPRVMADALTEAIKHDATGQIATTLKQSALGRSLLAWVPDLKIPDNYKPDAPPEPLAPPTDPVPRAAGRIAFPTVETTPSAETSTMTVENATAEPAPVVDKSAPVEGFDDSPEVVKAREAVALLEKYVGIQEKLIDVSARIEDQKSAAQNAVPWIAAVKNWQAMENIHDELAGQEFGTVEAAKYTAAKERSDLQSKQIVAEFERLEEIELLPVLNKRLVKQKGKAVGSAEAMAEANDPDSKPIRSSAPAALKRVPKKKGDTE